MGSHRTGRFACCIRGHSPAVDCARRLAREAGEANAGTAPSGSGLAGSHPEAETHRRHHLDLYAADQAAEVARLIELGAQRVDWNYEPGADYVVLADVDGNTFCVVQAGE